MRPKLTKSDLHEIGQRSNSPDVRALLWEIHRLRGIALRADQLVRELGDLGGAKGMMVESLRGELEGEPCVAEFPKLGPNGL
jgi:hypothetical protein